MRRESARAAEDAEPREKHLDEQTRDKQAGHDQVDRARDGPHDSLQTRGSEGVRIRSTRWCQRPALTATIRSNEARSVAFEIPPVAAVSRSVLYTELVDASE